jgi:hypothetical protein
MSSYAKSLTAVLGAIAVAVASAWTDNQITHPEWVTIAVAGFTAFQVYVTANVGLPLWNKAKAITAGALAGLGLLGGYLANGEHMNGSLWLNVAIAAATAAGVFAVPNEPEVIDVR